MIASFDPQVFFLGTLVVVCGFILFAGSGYVLLSGIFGARMAYFVEATAFFTLVALLSSLWTFGFWAGGPDTQTNQGPRGPEAGWAPIVGGVDPTSADYPTIPLYPGGPWKEPTEEQAADVDPLAASLREFAAAQANQQAGIDEQNEIPIWAGGKGLPEYELGKEPFVPTDFVVEDIRFSRSDDTRLGAGTVYYKNGGTQLVVVARYDAGHVSMWSWIFLIGSLIGFAIHVPFLDKEEQRRKGIVTSKPAAWRSGS